MSKLLTCIEAAFDKHRLDKSDFILSEVGSAGIPAVICESRNSLDKYICYGGEGKVLGIQYSPRFFPEMISPNSD